MEKRLCNIFWTINATAFINPALTAEAVAGLACNFIKKETLAQVFSCKFCEISKNTFSYRKLPLVASVPGKVKFETLQRPLKVLFFPIIFTFKVL